MLVFEIAIGFCFIILGFFISYWSSQLIWIEIYPPHFEKTLIEILPLIFWSIGILLLVDVLRKKVSKKTFSEIN
jgi:hypothetical protein